MKFSKIIPDKLYLSYKYLRVFKRRINWENPKTFNEKIQYIKLYQRDPLYTLGADKVKVKQYVEEKVGKDIIIPTYGVWDSFDEIDFSKLPNQFVLKTNHDWAGVYVCKNKDNMNMNKLKDFFESHLKENFYEIHREWAYKNIPPKIFAEKYLQDNEYDDIVDYKFFAFNGKVDCVMICTGRSSHNEKFYFMDENWNYKPFNKFSYEAIETNLTIPKPENINEMFRIAEKLSQGIPFVRVDLYSVNNHIYFGEMTFTPAAGYDNKLLPETDNYFGQLIDLTLIKRG